MVLYVIISTVLLYLFGLFVRDGILGGLVLVIGHLITLRSFTISNGESKLYQLNGLLLFMSILIFLSSVIVLPDCSRERHNSRYCRITRDYGSLLMTIATALVLFGTLSGFYFITFISSIVIGIIHYGMFGTPLTTIEQRQLSLKGTLTENPSLRLTK